MSAIVQHRLFTTAEYHQMAEAGILTEEDHTELIEGALIRMCPMGSRHAATCDRLSWILARRLEEDRFILRNQTPVILGERDEPQPDISIARFRADRYAERLPTAKDLILVIEVSDTTYDYDRNTKLPRYAESGVPEVWIIDEIRKRIELHRQPAGDLYAEARFLLPDAKVQIPGSQAVISPSDLRDVLGC